MGVWVTDRKWRIIFSQFFPSLGPQFPLFFSARSLGALSMARTAINPKKLPINAIVTAPRSHGRWKSLTHRKLSDPQCPPLLSPPVHAAARSACGRIHDPRANTIGSDTSSSCLSPNAEMNITIRYHKFMNIDEVLHIIFSSVTTKRNLLTKGSHLSHISNDMSW